jgi:hypothetical protein
MTGKVDFQMLAGGNDGGYSGAARPLLQRRRCRPPGRRFRVLGADMQEDTIYPIAFVDGDGNRLDAANKYLMHYDKGGFPPTNATWSVSPYPGSNYVPNAPDRYDIAPWMPLDYNPDGSPVAVGLAAVWRRTGRRRGGRWAGSRGSPA